MIKLQWETKKFKVNELIQLEINPRKVSEVKKKKLLESLDKYNLVEIPAVNTDLKIIGGNQRIIALLLSGRGEELIDVRYPNRTLTIKEVKEYNLISNSHVGEFDLELLMESFSDIDFEEIGLDLNIIEFENSDLFNKSLDQFEKQKESPKETEDKTDKDKLIHFHVGWLMDIHNRPSRFCARNEHPITGNLAGSAGCLLTISSSGFLIGSPRAAMPGDTVPQTFLHRSGVGACCHAVPMRPNKCLAIPTSLPGSKSARRRFAPWSVKRRPTAR